MQRNKFLETHMPEFHRERPSPAAMNGKELQAALHEEVFHRPALRNLHDLLDKANVKRTLTSQKNTVSVPYPGPIQRIGSAIAGICQTIGSLFGMR